MKLPNGEKAIVDIVKLRDYCLNSAHPEGRHKARVFLSALGIGPAEAARLRNRLRAAARNHEAYAADADQYGTRYVLDFKMQNREREAIVRAAWIIRKGENFPRLTTCYILRGWP